MSSVRIRRGSQYSPIADTPSTAPVTRPRSRTVTSIRNLYSTIPRRPSLPSLPSQDPPPSHHAHDFKLDGEQASIIVPNDRPPRPGSAFSLASLMSDDDTTATDEDHEHDIVDHLEVIDPTVAAVSNLANAANAILILPIGVYSRKPVIFLPKHAASAYTSKDAEKGAAFQQDDLDRHFQEVLSKKAKFLRTMQGVWAFIKTPMGIVAAIYGFLVAFWGAAIVFFLAKFINFHNSNTQGFWVEVSSQVENALFTVTGVGLLPWRVVDTYRIARIWHYKVLTRKLRRKAGLPELYDEDDLPDPIYDPNHVHVLSQQEQDDLHYQQQHFMKSQTWYRPHGTITHRAFPIHQALLICLFVDGNSFFQCILCGTMWGLNRFQRPAYSTGLLIPASFLCGIVAAILIWRGGQFTKRTKEVEERIRRALATDYGNHKERMIRDVLVAELPNLKGSASHIAEGQETPQPEQDETSPLRSRFKNQHDSPIPEEMNLPPLKDIV